MIPADPYSAEGFVYRPVANDPLGRDFLLYSVGADGQDDGGKSDPYGPHQALTPGGVGLDAVFNAPGR